MAGSDLRRRSKPCSSLILLDFQLSLYAALSSDLLIFISFLISLGLHNHSNTKLSVEKFLKYLTLRDLSLSMQPDRNRRRNQC